MKCIFTINGEEMLPTEEEKLIMLDRFAESLGYTRLEEIEKGSEKEHLDVTG